MVVKGKVRRLEARIAEPGDDVVRLRAEADALRELSDDELAELEGRWWANLETCSMEELEAARPREQHLPLRLARQCGCAWCADLARWAELVERR